MYNLLIDYLYQIESWNSNEAFLRDAIVTSSAKLLAKCHDEAEKNNLVMIAPLLRQVQESIIVISGLEEGVLTAEEFIIKQQKSSDIMNRIEEKGLQIKKSEFDFFNNYLKGVKNYLNKYSHTSFEGVMTLFTERFEVFEIKQFKRIMIRFAINLIEIPFLVMTNHIYKLDLEIPKAEDYQMELKELGTLKYVTRHFPDSIRDFIYKSELLKGYYLNATKDLKNLFHEFIERYEDFIRKN